MKNIKISKVVKRIILFSLTLVTVIVLLTYCFFAPSFIYPYILGIIITLFISNMIWFYFDASDKFSLLTYIKKVILHANYLTAIPFLVFTIIASIVFAFLGNDHLNSDKTSTTGISFIISAIYMPFLVIYSFVIQEGHFFVMAEYFQDKDDESVDKWFPVKFIFSHLTFYFLIFSTILGFALILNLNKVETMISEASTVFIIFMIVFEMIYVSTSPFNRLVISQKIKFTFMDGNKNFEVLDYGNNRYGVFENGMSGAIALFIYLIINIIISPFGIIIETYKLIDAVIKILNGKEVKLDTCEIKYSQAKEGNNRLLLPFFTMIFLAIQLCVYRSVYNVNTFNFEIKNALIKDLTSRHDYFTCEFAVKYSGSKELKDLRINLIPHLGIVGNDNTLYLKTLNIKEAGNYKFSLNINKDQFFISPDSYLEIEIIAVDFRECVYNFDRGENVKICSLKPFSVNKVYEEKCQSAAVLYNK